MPKVSIVITAHNYGRYLRQSIDSALNQTAESIEVVCVDDGSTDDTPAIMESYSVHQNFVPIRTEGIGLASASNLGIRRSTGTYVIRLDADDWFDENIVLVLSNALDRLPEIGMVFADYFSVDQQGDIIDSVKRARVNDEIKLLDRPCLAAGAMYRRKCFDAIGGYNEELRYQEDYDFWIKFIDKFAIKNINIPLMYYRQHGKSMSTNWDARMEARRFVKRRFVEQERIDEDLGAIAFIPARADILLGQKFPLLPFKDTTLLGNSIETALSLPSIKNVFVSTNDPEVAAQAESAGAEVPYLRPKSLDSAAIPFETVVQDLLDKVEPQLEAPAPFTVILHPHSPFITSDHVAEAINTMRIYDTDSVIGVVEDLTYHWSIGPNGLKPVGYKKRVVRQDKDLVFKEAGGLYVFKTANLRDHGELLGSRIGHIELSATQATRIRNQVDYEYANWLSQES